MTSVVFGCFIAISHHVHRSGHERFAALVYSEGGKAISHGIGLHLHGMGRCHSTRYLLHAFVTRLSVYYRPS